MRITENRLRKIIRKVLIEINTPQQAQAAMALSKSYGDEDDFEEALAKAYPEKKRKGIKLKVNRSNYEEDSLVLKLRKDLSLEDVISKDSGQLARTIDPKFKSQEKVIIEYKIDLIKNKKDESKANSFIGPLIGKEAFVIRYEGDVFAIKIRYMYPEDRHDHEMDMANKFKDLGFREMTKSTSHF